MAFKSYLPPPLDPVLAGWLKHYPEVLRVREDRTRQLYGERHNHCYTSPAYRERVRIINQKLTETFKNHPGVILWHISNEYRDECHCPLCQEAFRNWLRNKYKDYQQPESSMVDNLLESHL